MRSFAKVLGWGFLLILSAGIISGSLPAQTTDPTEPIRAVDARGTDIGQVVRMDFSLNRMQVALDVDGELVFVIMESDSFTHGTRPLVFFESSNCSGPAYMTTGQASGSFGAPAAVAGSSGTLYMGQPNTTRQRALASALWSNTCNELEGEFPVMNAVPVRTLGTEFLPPYRVISGTETPPPDDSGSDTESPVLNSPKSKK